MEYTYDNTEDTFLIFAFAVIIGFFIVLAFYFNVIAPFMKARDYIKMEMHRSDVNEYYYWKSELKRLYISHIPIIGRFFR